MKCVIFDWRAYELASFERAHDAYCANKEILVVRRPHDLGDERARPLRISRRIVRFELNWPLETFRLRLWIDELRASLNCELDFYVPV